MSRLTHIDETGRTRMVDVSDKASTTREAVAAGFMRMRPETLKLALSSEGSRRGRSVAGVGRPEAARRRAVSA